MFTVWSDLTANSPFSARRHYSDKILPHLHEEGIALKNNTEIHERIIGQFNNLISKYYIGINQTPFKFNNAAIDMTTNGYNHAFQIQDHAKILYVLMHANPEYLTTLTANSQYARKELFKLFRKKLERLGYHAVDVGANFSSSDFHDARHLSGSGGKKLAAQVADEVKKMAPIHVMPAKAGT